MVFVKEVKKEVKGSIFIVAFCEFEIFLDFPFPRRKKTIPAGSAPGHQVEASVTTNQESSHLNHHSQSPPREKT